MKLRTMKNAIPNVIASESCICTEKIVKIETLKFCHIDDPSSILDFNADEQPNQRMVTYYGIQEQVKKCCF
jgi:hypothetical protein